MQQPLTLSRVDVKPRKKAPLKELNFDGAFRLLGVGRYLIRCCAQFT